jgi:hypothetical protein
MTSYPAQSLASTVTTFRREVVKNRGNTELEVRLKNVDHRAFCTIYNSLINKMSGGDPIQVSNGTLTQMVGALKPPPARAGGRGHGSWLQATKIREIYFENDAKVREIYTSKEPLLMPFRVPSPVGVSYIVALANESPAERFRSDEGAIIRIKARVSFNIELPSSFDPSSPDIAWRIDMTVVRQITGGEADTSLKSIVQRMFMTKPAMTPETFLQSLRLDGGKNSTSRDVYRYEIEAEYVGEGDDRDPIRPDDITAMANTLLKIANPNHIKESAMQEAIYHVAQYLIKAPGYLAKFEHELGMKRLLPQALATTRADYKNIYPPVDHWVTDKADGRRALAVVTNNTAKIVSNELYNNFKGASHVNDTIVDGELVDRNNVLTFYAFDVIVVDGEDISRVGFADRRSRLADAVKILNSVGINAQEKPYVRINSKVVSEMKRLINEIYEMKRPYETDGLIFVEPGKPYLDTANYKWKPAAHNTIDFLVRRVPTSVLGKPPFVDAPGHKLYFLFVGIDSKVYTALGLQKCQGYAKIFGAPTTRSKKGQNRSSYFPIQFTPSDSPLAYIYQHPDNSPYTDIDGKIVELRCAGDCSSAGSGSATVDWELTRVREDRSRELQSGRYFGNDFRTAELIWLNYIDPFPVEQLWDGPGLSYFTRKKSSIYNAQTAVTSFVKSKGISPLKHASWVVDIGAGKGQDLGRYLGAEVQNLIAVDQDRAALSELVRRKFTHAKRRGASGSKLRTATSIHILAASANDPFATTVRKLTALGMPPNNADALVCNLAVHYFLPDIKHMRNFVALAHNVVKVGGRVILTILKGESVHKAFMDSKTAKGETWDIFETVKGKPEPIRKYSMRRMYGSSALEATGQAVGIMLPFSGGEYYTEFLVNSEVLSKEFAKKNFERIVPKAGFTSSISDAIPDFETRNRALAKSLTAGDREYLSLYGELVFRRTK